ILPSVVRHATNDAFAVEHIVRKRRDRTHVNAAQYQRASRLQVLERRWYQLAGGSKDDRGVHRLRWIVVGASYPLGAKLYGKSSMFFFSRGDDHLHSPMSRD